MHIRRRRRTHFGNGRETQQTHHNFDKCFCHFAQYIFQYNEIHEWTLFVPLKESHTVLRRPPQDRSANIIDILLSVMIATLTIHDNVCVCESRLWSRFKVIIAHLTMYFLTQMCELQQKSDVVCRCYHVTSACSWFTLDNNRTYKPVFKWHVGQSTYPAFLLLLY